MRRKQHDGWKNITVELGPELSAAEIEWREKRLEELGQRAVQLYLKKLREQKLVPKPDAKPPDESSEPPAE